MGINYRPLPTKCFIAFIEFHGFVKDRVSSSHHVWKKKGCLRPIVLQGNEKDVPPIHIRSNCKTIGCSMEDVYHWAKENC